VFISSVVTARNLAWAVTVRNGAFRTWRASEAQDSKVSLMEGSFVYEGELVNDGSGIPISSRSSASLSPHSLRLAISNTLGMSPLHLTHRSESLLFSCYAYGIL
jgi:hypothetical protein